MPNILYIDTSGLSAQVALSKNRTIIKEYVTEETRNHAALLNQLVQDTLLATETPLKNLDAIAVCSGPGSYTGLRIGMATAKGYCYAADIPLIATNKLQLLAQQVYAGRQQDYKHYVVALQARQGEYFLQLCDDTMTVIKPPLLATESELGTALKNIEGNVLITGDEASVNAIKNILPKSHTIVNDRVNTPAWVEYASKMYEQNEFSDIHFTEPFYLKEVFIHKKK